MIWLVGHPRLNLHVVPHVFTSFSFVEDRIPLKIDDWFPRLIVVPLSSHEVDGVRKEKERLTAIKYLDIHVKGSFGL